MDIVLHIIFLRNNEERARIYYICWYVHKEIWKSTENTNISGYLQGNVWTRPMGNSGKLEIAQYIPLFKLRKCIAYTKHLIQTHAHKLMPWSSDRKILI